MILQSQDILTKIYGVQVEIENCAIGVDEFTGISFDVPGFQCRQNDTISGIQITKPPGFMVFILGPLRSDCAEIGLMLVRHTTLQQFLVVCILHTHANKSDFSRKPYARLGAAGLR